MLNDDIFDMFSNLMDIGRYQFHRPTYDQHPYKAFQTDEGMTIVVNTLGISKDDISVELKNSKNTNYKTLHVVGETKIDKIGEVNKIDLSIIIKFNFELNTIKYEVKDGFTYVYLTFKEEDEEDNTLKATYVEPSDLEF